MSDARIKQSRLRKIMGGIFGFCHWCGNPIGNRKMIQERFEVVAFGNKRIHFIGADSLPCQVLCATLDHLKPRRDGGTFAIENLVASCEPCNSRRTSEAEKQRDGHCRKCWLPVFRTPFLSRNCCVTCQVAGLEAKLAEMKKLAEKEREMRQGLVGEY